MAVTGPSSPFNHFFFSSLPVLAFSLASLFLLFLSLYLKRNKEPQRQWPAENSTISFVSPPTSLSSIYPHQDLPKWAPVLSTPSLLHDNQRSGGGEGEQEKEEDKKRKKRARKKKQDSRAGSVEGVEDAGCGEDDRAAGTGGVAAGRHGADFIYPFSSFSSATQRRIKQQYDQLVKSNQAKALTMAQVAQFANCLIDPRNDLQHKYVLNPCRKLALTAIIPSDQVTQDGKGTGSRGEDRHPGERPQDMGEIYKLEAEHKRLEEDAIVYNRLQEQLKLSPAYKKMLEIGSRMESKACSDQGGESIDSEFADVSFEELLAQEKKDSFWQRNRKLRPCSS